MKHKDLERSMRRLESFHCLRVPDEALPIIRVDGRSFTKLTSALKYSKPFDGEFSKAMQSVATTLMREFNGIYAYTQSDEVSVLLRPDCQLFDREVEKWVSVSAGLASARFTKEIFNRLHQSDGAALPSFDSRILVLNHYGQIEDYFRWRQSDATRNYLNSLAYWTAVKGGKSRRSAGKAFEGVSPAFKVDFLKQLGIEPDFDSWQAKGIGFSWGEVEFNGLNKLTGERVPVIRRELQSHLDLPIGEAYATFLSRFY